MNRSHQLYILKNKTLLTREATAMRSLQLKSSSAAHQTETKACAAMKTQHNQKKKKKASEPGFIKKKREIPFENLPNFP